MKKFIIPIIFVVVVLLAAPYVTGKVAETQIHRLVEQLNQSSLQNGSSEIVSYDRSYFKSRSEYRYMLPIQYRSLLNGVESIDYQCDIDHGVIGIGYHCSVSNTQQYTDFINEYFEGRDPFSMFGVVNAFGGLSHTIAVEEVKDLKLGQDGSQINIAKTEVTIDTNKDLSRYDIHGDMASLTLTSANESMNIDKVLLGGDITSLQDGLFIGDLNFSINSMALSDSENTVNIEGLETFTSADQDDDKLDSTTQVAINKMTLANAPFEIADDLKFSLAVNDVSIDALLDYQAYTRKIQNQLLNSQENIPAVDPMEVVPIIERMLAKGFNIEFDLSGKLDEKSNSASFTLELIDSLNMSDAMALAYAPQETLNKLKLNIATKFNSDTVNADPKLAATVLNSPLFEQSSEEYLMNLNLGKESNLNGQSMTIQELQTLMMSSVIQPGQ